MGYSKLVWWEVINFMSIERAKCEFDEKGIINIKGYNDSGKSAMLTALRVLLSNNHPTKQVEFIQDGKEYFRIMALFDDNVMILRDKYLNGQSLYEMYKDNKLIFTTKLKNGGLSPVKGVPDPIAQYLGLITYEDTVLNARACFEKQIGVQTSGSENYKMFNTILKSEELASASEMLNNDRNKTVARINGVSSEIDMCKNLISGKEGITKEAISVLKKVDEELDENIAKENVLNNMKALETAISGIKIHEEIPTVNGVSDILNIKELKSDIDSIKINPNIDEIEDISDILQLKNILVELSSIKVSPHIDEIDTLSDILEIKNLAEGIKRIKVEKTIEPIESIDDLLELKKLSLNLNALTDAIAQNESNIKILHNELHKAYNELKAQGVELVKCPSCGSVFPHKMETA